jgi:hypothetical protein
VFSDLWLLIYRGFSLEAVLGQTSFMFYTSKVHMVILYIHAKLFIEFCIGLGAINFKKKKENISEENRGRGQYVRPIL